MIRRVFAGAVGLVVGVGLLTAAGEIGDAEVPDRQGVPDVVETSDDPAPESILCDAGETLNDAGDGCEALPDVEPERVATGTVEVSVEIAPLPDAEPEPEVIHEDDPRWDCRVMGNRACGVEISGTWYVVRFDDDGAPVAVAAR